MSCIPQTDCWFILWPINPSQDEDHVYPCKCILSSSLSLLCLCRQFCLMYSWGWRPLYFTIYDVIVFLEGIWIAVSSFGSESSESELTSRWTLSSGTPLIYNLSWNPELSAVYFCCPFCKTLNRPLYHMLLLRILLLGLPCRQCLYVLLLSCWVSTQYRWSWPTGT